MWLLYNYRSLKKKGDIFLDLQWTAQNCALTHVFLLAILHSCTDFVHKNTTLALLCWFPTSQSVCAIIISSSNIAEKLGLATEWTTWISLLEALPLSTVEEPSVKSASAKHIQNAAFWLNKFVNMSIQTRSASGLLGSLIIDKNATHTHNVSHVRNRFNRHPWIHYAKHF